MKKITFLFVALATIFLVTACSSSKTPSDTVKTYYDHVKSGNYEKAVKCFYFEEEAKKEDIEAFAAKMKASYAESGKNTISKIEILNEEINEDGDRAKVEVKILYKDGTEDTEKQKLKKTEKGEWKLEYGK